jgi:hypothetical protein
MNRHNDAGDPHVSVVVFLSIAARNIAASDCPGFAGQELIIDELRTDSPGLKLRQIGSSQLDSKTVTTRSPHDHEALFIKLEAKPGKETKSPNSARRARLAKSPQQPLGSPFCETAISTHLRMMPDATPTCRESCQGADGESA